MELKPSSFAQSCEERQIGQRRPDQPSDINRFGADIGLIFEARETMKRAKLEYEDARQII
jgi:hypothetical protein